MKILNFVVLVLLSLSVQAKEIERVTYGAACMEYAQLLEVVDTFGEIPLASGISVPIGKPNAVSSIVIFVNSDTKTFTVAEKVTENKYCVIALGINFGPVSNQVQKEFKDRQDKQKI